MAEIIWFSPKRTNECQQNLDDFITLCRDRLTVFGEDLDWHAESWPGIANFTKIGAHSRGYCESDLLDAAIMPFAKAYLRYQQGQKPTKLKNEMKAIRCIERALVISYGKADITLVDIQVMDVATEVAREYKATAYQAGMELSRLVQFLSDSGIIKRAISWRNPFSKPLELKRTDAEAKVRRSKKIPSDHCLQYMAEMFSNNLQEPRDRFTTAIFGLLMCAPSRISEVQLLPVNCLHREMDKDGVERLGLRWWAGKGYGCDIKWIPTIFKDLALEAVRRLSALSEPARLLAKHYEDNPSEFYRHELCPNVEERTPLTLSEAEAALGFKPNRGLSARQMFKDYAPYRELCASGQSVTLEFLHAFCLSKLPVGWPWLRKDLGIKYSDALCCFRMHELRPDLSTSPVLLWFPDNNVFSDDLKTVPGRNKSSIWQRHGYRNPDGSNIKLTSHQVRHYLNTAAQRGDLGQLDLAKWSGRVNVSQNSVYNHLTDDEYVSGARKIGVGSDLIAKIGTMEPVTIRDLEAVGEGIAHVTEFGFCVHDFSMMPCQLHRDCLNCTEQVCVKGDYEKLARLKARRDAISRQLDKARAALGDGVYGADRWSMLQLRTLERVEQLIFLLESPQTPEGSVIRLSNDQEHSPLKTAISNWASSAAQPLLMDEELLTMRSILSGE